MFFKKKKLDELNESIKNQKILVEKHDKLFKITGEIIIYHEIPFLKNQKEKIFNEIIYNYAENKKMQVQKELKFWESLMKTSKKK